MTEKNEDFETYEDFLACFEMDEDPRDKATSETETPGVATYELPDGTKVDIEL